MKIETITTVITEWYEELVSECKAIITEAIFTSRWSLVEGYWKLGERIQEDKHFKAFAKGNKSSVQDLARNLGISERTLYYALQLYKKYPKLDLIPDGKNITWNKLITFYLPAPKENKIEIITPKGKFNVIIIDPPWPYETEYNSESRRVGSPYAEMSIEELKKLKLPAANDCSIWMWTTHKFLPEAFELLKHWGFEYKLTLAWDKQKLGMGEWLRCQTEFCLLGIKGRPNWNLTNQRDFISEARREHSRKPDAFYEMVKKLCEGKRIDYFSREKRDGYEQFGNQTTKF